VDHTWESAGTYDVKVQARDSHGGVSAWSSPRAVRVEAVQGVCLLSPNGGESYPAGAAIPVRWLCGGFDAKVFRVDFSSDGGQRWTPVATGSAASASGGAASLEALPTAGASGDRCRMRVITQGRIAGQSDVSDGNFNIEKPWRIDLSYPDRERTLRGRSDCAIAWSSDGARAVDIWVRLGRAATWMRLAGSVSAALGAWTWSVPDTNIAECCIRVAAVDRAEIADSSSQSFAIVSERLAILSPLGGETWKRTSVYPIRFECRGGFDKAELFYGDSTAGESMRLIGRVYQPEGEERVQWRPGLDLTPTKRGCVEIVASKQGLTLKARSGFFRLDPSSMLRVASPEEDERYSGGTTCEIKWELKGKLNAVSLEYLDETGQYRLIAAGVAADRKSYSWTLPRGEIRRCRVRIRDEEDATISAESGEFFVRRANEPPATPAAPRGPESARVGDSCVYSAYSVDPDGDAVTLSFEWGDGRSVDRPAGASPGNVSASHVWDAPGVYRVRARARDARGASSAWSAPLCATVTVRPVAVLLVPNGGESLRAGSGARILWRVEGEVGPLSLAWRGDGGDFVPIAANLPSAAGAYAWTVPAGAHADCRVRIMESGPDPAADASDAAFEIYENRLTILAPEATAAADIGDPLTVRWSAEGRPGGFDLEFRDDTPHSRQSIRSIARGLSGSRRFYIWTIPPDLAPTDQARIVAVGHDARDGTPFEASSERFRLNPRREVRVNAPNGGETLTGGSRVMLRWWNTANIAAVDIDLLLTGRRAEIREIARGVPASGGYEWLAPDEDLDHCRIEVRESGRADVRDESDADFAIRRANRAPGFSSDPRGPNSLYVQENGTWRLKAEDSDGDALRYRIDWGDGAPPAWSSPLASGLEYAASHLWRQPGTYCLRFFVKDARGAETEWPLEWKLNVRAMRLTLTYPNAIADSLLAGSEDTVRWNWEGPAERVSLAWSADGGEWADLADGVVNAGKWPWRVPDTLARQCRLRLWDADRSAAADTCDQPFAIYRLMPVQVLAIRSPIEREVIATSDTPIIEWRIGEGNLTGAANLSAAAENDQYMKSNIIRCLKPENFYFNLYYSSDPESSNNRLLISRQVKNLVFDWDIPDDFESSMQATIWIEYWKSDEYGEDVKITEDKVIFILIHRDAKESICD